MFQAISVFYTLEKIDKQHEAAYGKKCFSFGTPVTQILSYSNYGYQIFVYISIDSL